MTTVDRRLDKVEAGLSPTELILRWLAEAHAHDDFSAYTRSLVATEWPVFPLDRLADAAKANATQQARGLPREEAEAAINRAIVAAVFRFQLVLRINYLAHDFLDREILILAALAAYVALATSDGEETAARASFIKPVVMRDVLFARVNELHALEAAREAVEARYLDGVAALFPAGQRAWAEQRTRSETAAVMALRLADLDGAEERPDDDPVVFDARVGQLVADHVEPARSNAWDQLGDGRRAQGLAIRWLRPKLLGEGPRVSEK
jgi:hypothetical protein